MKIERSKEIVFSYESKMPDIGRYRRAFVIQRITPGLQIAISRTKSRLMGGETPVRDTDAVYLEWVAYISVLCEPVWAKGEIPDDDWLDNEFLNDVGMVRALYEEIVAYNNGFYLKKASTEESTDAVSTPGA